jgi:acyl-CoA thioester hydrolase
MSNIIEFKTRWADFDANRHLRHTSYNDYAAEARLQFFKDNGIDLKVFNKLQVGPILFTENTSFRKEIHLGEKLSVSIFLEGLSENGERWKIGHKIYNEKNQLAAEISVYGAWMDLVNRKLTTPPDIVKAMFDALEKASNFEVIPMKK